MKYFAVALFGVVFCFSWFRDDFSSQPAIHEEIDIMVPELALEPEQPSGQKAYLTRIVLKPMIP